MKMAEQNKEYIPDLGKLNELHTHYNRDELAGMSMFDLLCRIQNGIACGARCSIEAITGEPYSCRFLRCDECISQWLNKESTGLKKEVDFTYENMSNRRT